MSAPRDTLPLKPTVRIAAAQYPLDRFDTLDAYRQKLSEWVVGAATDGAELVVFPEYGAMEFAGPDAAAAGNLAASLKAVAVATAAMESTYLKLSRTLNVHILAASGPCYQGSRIVNRAKLFAPSGVIGWQDKMIMTPFEDDWGLSAGGPLRVFDTTLGAVGIAICYDSEFPLISRALREAGAEIILIPSCTEFVSGYHRVRTAALARALENGCVTVQSPTVGTALWSPAVDHNFGAAGIFVPSERGISDNGVVAEGQIGLQQWVTATVDLDALRQLSARGEMRNGRDWDRQPGASALAHLVERVSLR